MVFFLEKQAFWDVRGDSFNLQHALSYPKGGLVITNHNKLRSLTAEILGKFAKMWLLSRYLHH